MRAARALELGAWVVGITLLAGYAAARWSFESARAGGIEAFRASQPPAVTAADEPSGTVASGIDLSLWSEQRIAAFRAATAEPGPPEGLLRIPSLGLEVPIYPGTRDANLDRGAAHIEGTGPLGGAGNAGIVSHRDGFFRKLKDISIDDELELEVAGGRLLYRVVDLAIVSPRDVHVLAPTEVPSVTLVTCYPFWFVGHAPQRYVVRAERRDAAAGEQSSEKISQLSASKRGGRSHEH